MFPHRGTWERLQDIVPNKKHARIRHWSVEEEQAVANEHEKEARIQDQVNQRKARAQ